MFDPLTGATHREVPRYTVYPKGHYVTPKQRLVDAIELIKDELNEQVQVLEETSLAGSPAPQAAHTL